MINTAKHNFILNYVRNFLILDFLIDVFTESQKTKAIVIENVGSDGSVKVQVEGDDTYLYKGKLLNVLGQLYYIFSFTENNDFESLIDNNETDITYDPYYNMGIYKNKNINNIICYPLNMTASGLFFGYGDHILITKNDIVNVPDGEQIETSIGRLLLNYVWLADPFGDIIPYMNNTIRPKKDIDPLIVTLLIEGKIKVDQAYAYSRNLYYLQRTELAVPAFTKKSICINPAIIKRRDELLIEYAEEIKNGNAIVMNKIEEELVRMDKEDISTDVSAVFYDHDSKSYENHRKNMFITVGAVNKFGDESNYNFIDNNIDEGWDFKNFATICNEIRRGSFGRAKETAKGGEESKFLIRIFQNTRIIEDTCDSTRHLTLELTKDNIKDYYYRNVLSQDNKTYETIYPENVSKFVNRTIKMRSPQTCSTKNGYCYSCCGEDFRQMNQEIMTMNAITVGTEFLNLSMKAMHQASLGLFEVTSVNKYLY